MWFTQLIRVDVRDMTCNVLFAQFCKSMICMDTCTHTFIMLTYTEILRIIRNVWSSEDQEPFISTDHLSHQTMLHTAAGTKRKWNKSLKRRRFIALKRLGWEVIFRTERNMNQLYRNSPPPNRVNGHGQAQTTIQLYAFKFVNAPSHE